MARRLPEVGGVYIQMEDEMASMAAILGASWGGVKSMTSTSGPGFSLMMENVGLGMMTETPCVVINIQRGGPSTGLPTLVGQADVMQARWGAHGDYGCIALAPASPQDCFDLTVHAFNLSEIYRQPVFVIGDEVVGHMTGWSSGEELQVVAAQAAARTGECLPFDNGPMPAPWPWPARISCSCHRFNCDARISCNSMPFRSGMFVTLWTKFAKRHKIIRLEHRVGRC
jgi:2-oxoglutarate ferredoxin oxidoreductase subunit alpha